MSYDTYSLWSSNLSNAHKITWNAWSGIVMWWIFYTNIFISVYHIDRLVQERHISCALSSCTNPSIWDMTLFVLLPVIQVRTLPSWLKPWHTDCFWSKCIYVFYHFTTLTRMYDSGSWYPSLWKMRTFLSNTANTVAADDLVIQKARASSTIFQMFSIKKWALEGLNIYIISHLMTSIFLSVSISKFTFTIHTFVQQKNPNGVLNDIQQCWQFLVLHLHIAVHNTV